MMSFRLGGDIIHCNRIGAIGALPGEAKGKAMTKSRQRYARHLLARTATMANKLHTRKLILCP